MHGYNIEGYYKQDVVTNMKFESIITSIKRNFFHQRMVDFANTLELIDQKYLSNRTVSCGIYKGKFLFPMKYLLSFRTYLQLVYFMSTILLKYKISVFRVPSFQLAYIRNTTHPSHKQLVRLCREVYYMRWLNQ